MHIVYIVTFPIRKYNNILPYYYVGSKSNCKVTDKKIYLKSSKEYWGSSSWEGYNDIVSSDNCFVEVLAVSEIYQEILEEERKIHIELDVVTSPEYFNKSIATTNNFTNPDFATYKHILHGKIVRLERTHPMVLSGEYVGVTSGNKLSDDTKLKMSISNSGKKNGFFEKRHTDETKHRIGLKNKDRVKSQEEIDNWVQKVAKLPMTESHKKSISILNKDKVMLKNFDTNITIKVHRSELSNYDLSIWKNPATIQKKHECIHCGISTNRGNLNRWHNDNCKFKTCEE